MKIRDSVAFVTGANRGLGLVFAQELLAADAKKVLLRGPKPRKHHGVRVRSRRGAAPVPV